MAKKVEKTRKPDLRTRTLMAMPNQKAILDEAANKLTWAEARLKLGPTIHALICDLWEKGYCSTGQYLECLAKKEDVELASGNIVEIMADDRVFIYGLIDNFKKAEDYERSTSCTTYKAAFLKYYEALKLVDEHNINNKYDWLYEEIFKIITKIFNDPKNAPGAANEMIARANFYYAHYLAIKDPRSEYAITLLERSVQLSCGENWCPDTGLNFENRYKIPNCKMEGIKLDLCNNFYVLATRKLIQLLLACFDYILPYNLEKAEKLSNEIFKHYDQRHGIWIFFYVLMAKAKYLIEIHAYKNAYRVLMEISTHYFVASEEICKLYCDRYLLVGICHKYLKHVEESDRNFSIALKLSKKFNLKCVEAEALVNIGLLFSEYSAKACAQKSFHLARSIYENIGDSRNSIKVAFLLAKLRADTIFPALLDLLKHENCPCATFHLRRWKNMALPFIDYMHEIDIEKSTKSVSCLINEMKYDVTCPKNVSHYFKS